MTVREIAKATSKPERTVHNWVQKTSAKVAQVYAKMAQAADDKKPADYSLDETLAIIETGLGKNAALLFKANAENNQKAITTQQPIEQMFMAFMNQQAEMNRQQAEQNKMILQLLARPQPQMIEFYQDYYSIKGYANHLGQQIAYSEALALGRYAAKLSREKRLEIRKIDDEAYGKVNSYHVSILEEVFSL